MIYKSGTLNIKKKKKLNIKKKWNQYVIIGKSHVINDNIFCVLQIIDNL